jgi:hypothetical protein
MSIATFFHRRSLTFSVLASVIASVAVLHAFGFSMRSRPPDSLFALRFIIACVVAFVACIHAIINLIRDVERGYSPARCSLAAVLLLFAFSGSTWAALCLASMLVPPDLSPL